VPLWPIGVEGIGKGSQQLTEHFGQVLAHDALRGRCAGPKKRRGFAAKFQRKIIKNWCELPVKPPWGGLAL
jgi:hypothetical protein